ncbi:acetoacetate--CoA ligase [Desulfomonile tiedjei]|uniref:Acetoacetyl-CoA synthase n=1 Tax=Desulfomonile tiedjei (strain ATCC 49306 / DSM 6799 / DCB-1) TaxID=706587 RepID=I4C7M5_DESTA|nr:acetoacetate--CoA ligase [Desulfomonile tiedjei]AFM25566.1 acetoacetyl-CoA synthase [Desulfomonile tiedjei DSM 6799]
MPPLWKPSQERIDNANITRFIKIVNDKYKLDIKQYSELYQWSVTNRADFWAEVWEFGGVIASKPWEKVLEDSPSMIGAKWFLGARLNFAENLLRFRDNEIAIIFRGEGLPSTRITYAELYDNVARMAKSLRDAGVKTGDRVAGYVPNMTETIIAMLAATSIGAIWSSCSPDFGIKGVLDRFGQIEPKILFTANGYYYNGKAHDSLERISGILKELPSIEKVVVIPYTEERADISKVPNSVHYRDFISPAQGLEIEFEQLPFDHPLYIMYSSGTTGLPKCMVHGAGGTLMQHLKEHLLHVDLKREDNIYYFTTCGWMMWNWLASALAVGATVLLYDGSPFYPDSGAIFQLAEDEKMTIFGTSARYIAGVEKSGLKPGEKFDLSNLKTMCSTGSPLSEESFQFVYRDVKQDIDLASISGGTDIISCFALGCPILPVYEGELQCRGLGMKVEAYDFRGNSVIGQQGELVCSASFPCMPIYFWNDPDFSKYKKAYFDVYPNVWHHGDFIEITEHGGVKIFGRSDATLNPSGVRIGTAEIYRVVEAIEEISDSIVVGQNWENDVRVILFVKTAANAVLDDNLKNKIKKLIRENTTPRHVPALILPVSDIPCTLNGKKVELAVRNVLEGKPVTNKDALANPEALDQFANIPELS